MQEHMRHEHDRAVCEIDRVGPYTDKRLLRLDGMDGGHVQYVSAHASEDALHPVLEEHDSRETRGADSSRVLLSVSEVFGDVERHMQ